MMGTFGLVPEDMTIELITEKRIGIYQGKGWGEAPRPRCREQFVQKPCGRRGHGSVQELEESVRRHNPVG